MSEEEKLEVAAREFLQWIKHFELSLWDNDSASAGDVEIVKAFFIGTLQKHGVNLEKIAA